ncbi:hypothetical protein [Helicobacter cappadocius]|uniref:FeoB-associated Cys-rich membrane protein n=1 Tax=Helicobacter cappadocius TaxID=3063998 RepID=A0AA90TBK4_9HELI|nr:MULTISPECIES: hypothetical protein [unclassified Helicobacter]MDO7252808.1 hypothetical protein [Helicobacter sp. faydin-H75]MDP2538851.1 hypothetical protein [Helicobacter sp. faydin-H76]
MQLIDIFGILLVVFVIGIVIYRILGRKKSSCGCGSNKCSKPKHYSSKDE